MDLFVEEDLLRMLLVKSVDRGTGKESRDGAE